MAKFRHTNETFASRGNSVHNGKYSYELVEYTRSKGKVKIICPEHGVFLQRAESHLQGKGCIKCGFDSNKRPIEDVQREVEKLYNGNIVWLGNDTARCDLHGVFSTTVHKLLTKKKGCGMCRKESTHEKRLQKILNRYKSRYLIKGRLLTSTPCEVECSKHGIFKATYNQMIAAKWKPCSMCRDEDRAVDYTKGQKHRVIYGSNPLEVVLFCEKHKKEYQIRAGMISSLKSKGCDLCYAEIKEDINKGYCLPLNEWIERANRLHDYKYGYRHVHFERLEDKVRIVCPDHGIFTQRASVHIMGSGCSSCSKKYSKIENQWLDSLNIDHLERQKTIRLNNESYVIVDGFDSKTNTIYEFHGDFWHGNLNKYEPNDVNPVNGKTYKELFENTQRRKKLCEESGYNVIEMWEADYLRQRQ